MNGRIVCGAGLVLAGLMTTPVAAQEKGDTGLTISAPSAIGVIWHVSEKVAVRPEVSFSFSGTDGDSANVSDIKTHIVTLGGSALFYLGRWDSLRTYFAPRLSYSWSGSSTGDSGFDIRSNQDCLKKFAIAVTAAGVISEAELVKIHHEVLGLIEQAVTAAKAAPLPGAADLLTDVYVKY